MHSHSDYQMLSQLTPYSEFEVLTNDKYLTAKAFDNRYGCALAVEVLKSTPASSASSLLLTPISINIFLISIGFLRSSGVKTCGGLEPMIPLISLPEDGGIKSCYLKK
jgi:hypothetical protein